MEKTNRKSVRLGAIWLLVILSLLAVFTLTACQQGIEAKSIAIDEESVPDVVQVGEDWYGQVKILVTVSEEEGAEPVEIALLPSMLPAATREDLKTPGQKTVTVYYQGKAAVFEILVVEEGTETATATFYDKDNKKITAKTVIKGNAVTPPAAPEVDGQAFVEWVVLESSASATSILSALEEDVNVKAKYAANATYYTVTVVGPDGATRGTTQVLHGNKISLNGIDTSLSSEYDASTLTWAPDISTYVVTNNVTVKMIAQKKTKTVEYCYAFESQPQVSYSLGVVEHVVVGQSVSKQRDAQNAISSQGLTFIEWQNTSTTVNADTKFVAIVKDRTFTVRYKNGDHTSETLTANSRYELPTTAAAKAGHTFNGSWKDASGQIYSGTVVISKDLVLEAVYNKKVTPVKIIFNFDKKDPATGRDIQRIEYDNTTKYDDRIDMAFVSTALERIKSGDAELAGFEIEKIVYKTEDVTAKGVTLTELVGTNPHEFTVTVINSELGTSDLTIVNGVVKAYTGSATGIYIPATYQDAPVTEIEANAFAGLTIVRILIPDSVKKIGAGAFANVTFGSDVQLPALTVLGNGVFEGAKTVRISADDEDPVYADVSVTFASGEGVITALPQDTFKNSKNIVSVALPASVKTIGTAAFCDSDVAAISGLENVETVSANAFNGTKLTALDLPKLATIGGVDADGNSFAFANMAELTSLSVATDSAGTIAFSLADVRNDAKLRVLTLGKGVTSFVFNDFADDIVNVEIGGLNVKELQTIALSDKLSSMSFNGGLDELEYLTALKAINVASGNAKYLSDDGVLYTVTSEKASLAFFPAAKGGDYTVPAKVGGVTVNAIATDFDGNRLNTLTVNDDVVKAIVAAAAGSHAATTKVQNVVVKGSLLGDGETLATNVEKLRAHFFYAVNLYVNGGSLTAETIRTKGWTDVHLTSDDVSVYNDAYGLTYEKVTVNNVSTARILFGNSSVTDLVVPDTIGGLKVTEIASGAFKNFTRLKSLRIEATLSAFASDALAGATALNDISISGWTDKATVSPDAFDDTLWASSRNLLALGGKLIKYNDLPADEDAGISTDLVAADFAGVKEIPAEFFKDKNNLTSVVLSTSVVKIGKEAFSGSGLKTIDLANVMKIEESAFAGALYLERIELINVAEMGAGVFEDCSELTEAIINASINTGYLPAGTFRNCTSLETVTFGAGALNGFAVDITGKSEAFLGCSALENVDFLATVSEIPEGTFNGCAAIKYLDFTKYAVTEIGEQAFMNCSGLEAIVISSDVVSIGQFAFGECSLLKAVRFVGNGGILAVSANVIDYDIFPVDTQETTYDYTIYISNSSSKQNIIRYDARIQRDLPRVDFKMYPGYAANGSLGLIDEETIYMDIAPEAPAFEGYEFDAWYYLQNTSYKKVTFPYSVERDVSFFARYFNVKTGSIVAADDLLFDEEKKEYALVNYTNFTDDAAYIPATYDDYPITTVYIGIFAACENLKELVLPAGVKTIKKGTPNDSTASPTHLTKLTIPATVTEIEAGALANLDDLDIVFAEGSKLEKADKNAFVGSKWYNDKKALAQEGRNNGFIIAGHLAIEYFGESKTVELPSDLYKLADELFAGNTDIEEIVINNALTYIGERCFTGATNLAYVTYADETVANEVDGGNHNSSLVYATAESFEGTKWLNGKNKAIIGTIFLKYNGLTGEESVVIPDYITVINGDAFRGDGTVKEVRFGAASNLVKIGDYAFAQSKLTKVTLPAIREMGVGVFSQCAALRTADLSNVLIETLPNLTFSGDAALNTLTLSDSIILLGTNSLTGCVALSAITANNLVKTDFFDENGLFDTAFYNVEATEAAQYIVLGKILVKYVPGTVVDGDEIVATVPDGVEVVLAEVFMSSAIAVVNIPASVKVIEQNAFYLSSSLREVAFVQEEEGPASALTEIGDMAFSNTALAVISLPEGLTKIGAQAFANTAVTSIELSDNVEYVGYHAFFNSALGSVVIGSGVTFIGEGAFGNCSNLYKVNFNLTSDGLTELNKNIEDAVKAAVQEAIDAHERVEEYAVSDFEAHVKGIFDKVEPAAVRMYVDKALYNTITNSSQAQVRAWRNENAEIYTNGDYPQVNFDNGGYYMPSFQTEQITELGVPAKTGSTFMGWYLSNVEGVYSNPLVLPYDVNKNTTIYAKWFANTLANEPTDGDELVVRSDGEGYIVTSVTPTAETVSSKTLYIPSTIAGLPVKGIDLSADVNGIETIVLTNASAFAGLTKNVFFRFPDLKEVKLLSDDDEETDMVVTDGVVYTKDGETLVAYLVTYNEDETVATEFVVPETVAKILPYAFDNSGLTKIVLSANVEAIGEHAFNDELTEIEFAEGIFLTQADSRSFDNTVWYLGDGGVPAARTDYVVNGSTVGFFYSAGNILLRYQQQAQANALNIPNQLKGFDVTVIASYVYAEARDNESVQEISFATMTLPNKLAKINSKAFAKINVRTNIMTESTVLNDIADDVFSHTTYYNNNNSDMIRLGNVLLKWISTTSNIVVPEGIVAISNNAFNSSQVQRLTLPSTLKYIGDNAFYNCADLTSVNFPDSLISIGSEAFAICQKLSTVTFNVGTSQLVEIGEQAFESCKMLTSVALPYRLETLSDKAFNNCIRLATVTFDYVTEENVDNVVVTTLQEKSKMTYLGESVFGNCIALTSIALPNGIQAIKTGAFLNCSALKKVTFDVDLSKVTTIESEAFAGCTALGGEIDVNNPSLVTLVLPNSLVRISESAFKDCESLFGVRINYNVRYIEQDVFSGCKNLAKIDVYSSTPATIAASAFNRGENVIYKLRIYVGNSPSGNVKANYKRLWSTYADSIYERNEIPVLYYTVNDSGNTVASNPIESDVIVSPSWTYKGTNYTTWVYSEFATVTTNGSETTTTIDTSAKRLNMNVSSGAHAVVQGSYVIVIADYDVVKLKPTL